MENCVVNVCLWRAGNRKLHFGFLLRFVRAAKFFRAAGLSILLLFCAAATFAQANAPQKPLLAEDVFKNVQVLRGISVDEFMGTMGFFAASLGLNCVDCHTNESVGNWSKFADDTPRKQMARKMVLMVKSINQGNFGGGRRVTCYTCHRGSNTPDGVPSLAEQYGEPPAEDPDRVTIPAQPLKGPPAEQLIDKYIQAIGGAEQLAKLTGYIGKGTYVGYDTDEQEVPTDVFVKAPAERVQIVHTHLGDDTTVFNGRQAWVASIHEPLPLLALSGGELEGVRVDAQLALPIRLKDLFTNWRSGFPETAIEGRAVQVIEGTSAGGTRVKLFFDKASGLLVRQARDSNTVVGFIPTHVDYSDYRPVAGVKIPFHWVTTWTDGQSTTQLTEVRPNAPIDESQFAQPAPAQVTK